MIFKQNVPELGVNDRDATVVRWLVDPLSRVDKGTPICELETSKAAFNLEATHEGVIRFLFEEGDTVAIQEAVAVVGSSPEEVEAYGVSADGPTPGELKVSRKAMELATKHGLEDELASLATLDRTIREQDVLSLLGGATDPETVPEYRPHYCDAIAVFNATGGGLAVVEVAQSAGVEVVCLIDDKVALVQEHELGLPVVTSDVFTKQLRDRVGGVFVHLQKEAKKEKTEHFFSRMRLKAPTLVHAQAIVSERAVLGEGALVKAGAIVDIGAVVGNHSIIDNGVIVPHHCSIGSYCHVSPGVSMGGDIRMGDACVVGIGAAIAPGLSIGQGAIILPGAVVHRDVEAYTIIGGQSEVAGVAKRI